MSRKGFTWIELLIVIVIIGILIGMLLPATRQVREAGRRATCLNNIRQIALATHNYESAHKEFPAAMGDHRLVEKASHDDADRLSGLMLVLPFMASHSILEVISEPSNFNGIEFPAMGPPPWDSRYEPWATQQPEFRCPSAMRSETEFGQTNYAFCIGDTARGIHNQKRLRGAFGAKLNAHFDDFRDGTSNIIFLAEVGTSGKRFAYSNFAVGQPISILDDPRACLKLLDASDSKLFDKKVELAAVGRGGCWADGSAGSCMVNTILPPNSPSVSVTRDQTGDGIYSAGSSHPGVVLVAMADGSAHSISANVDTGQPNASTLTEEQMADGVTPSPFGVYGALGTIAGEEEASIDDL